jgi:hypothetical protein
LLEGCGVPLQTEINNCDNGIRSGVSDCEASGGLR